MVMSGRSVNLSILFPGRLRPPKRLSSTSCTYFRQLLFFNQRKEKRKYVAGPLDIWLLSQTRGEGYDYILTDQMVAAGMGVGRLGRGRLIEDCRNKIQRCTV